MTLAEVATEAGVSKDGVTAAPPPNETASLFTMRRAGEDDELAWEAVADTAAGWVVIDIAPRASLS